MQAGLRLAHLAIGIALANSAIALPITHYEPGYGNAGPLVLAKTPWIPPRCCDLYTDCFQIPKNDVTQDADGYNFVWRGNRYHFPFKDVLNSEDGNYYACFPGGKLLCFAAPLSGS